MNIRYRLMLGMAAVLLLGQAVLPVAASAASRPVSARAAAVLDSVERSQLPTDPFVGDTSYSTWTYRYLNRYGTAEYYAALYKADAWYTWQTRNTWPYFYIAKATRFAFIWNGAYWDIGATWIKNTGLFDLWGVECDVTYRYNGLNVYTDGSNTCNAWGAGFNVSVTPVVWNDGGNYFGALQFGANYRVSVFVQGTPLFADHWMRESIFTNGSVSGPSGG